MQCVRLTARVVVLGGCLAWLVASPVRAQSTDWADRAFLNVNLGLQLTSSPFEERLTPIINNERASIDGPHLAEGGLVTLDVGGGVRLWKGLGVGATYTRFQGTEEVTIAAQVPNPVYFNQPRSAFKVSPLARTESVLHLQAVYGVPITPRMDVVFSGGPSLLGLQQDVVTGIDVTEGDPPFSTVVIGNVATTTRDERGIGFNAGADVTYFLTRLAGVGVTVRYTWSTVGTELGDGRPIDLSMGGLQIGVGARVRVR